MPNKTLYFPDGLQEQVTELLTLLDQQDKSIPLRNPSHRNSLSESKLIKYLIEDKLRTLKAQGKRIKPPLPMDIVYGDDDYNK